MIGAKAPYSHKAGLKHMSLGAGDRSRTRDILITSEALYQLSYTGEAAGLSRDLREPSQS